ncbi:MAG: hypothetical protein JWR38_6000 [Mucilaginibacter sp.]|nr:hypothetical protein [Mucilaginibacter sp.]
MSKIPVGATIAHAYRFALRDFLQIFAVIWPSWAIISAGSFLLRNQMADLSTAMAARDFHAVAHVWSILLPFYLVLLVLMFMQMVGIAQQALGLRTGPRWFYFSLGGKLWRFIGSALLLLLAMVLAWLAALLGSLLLGMVMKGIGNAVPAIQIVTRLVSAAGFIALWCAVFYAWLRLSFLLLPVIAAGESGMALARSWTLGKGNFWRMFLVLVAVIAPFIVLEVTVLFSVMMHGMPHFPPPHASPEQRMAFNAALQAHNTAMMGQLYGRWYITFPLFGIFTILFYGTVIGAQCFTWRALTSAPVAGDGLPD